jgi:hypothetical protein
MATKTKKPTYQDLVRQNLELKAALASACSFASKDLHKAGDALMGSGVLLQLTALGGSEIINPVVIRDGLSTETIAALKADLLRSFNLATMTKPQ